MGIWLLLIAFVLVGMSTMLLFRSVGVSPRSILFSRTDALAFQSQRPNWIRAMAVSSTIFGTLTSLATVYVFFLGSSKLFGYFVFAAPLSMALSAIPTRRITNRILDRRPDLAALLDQEDRSFGVVARVLWTPAPTGMNAALATKWISLVNSICVLWLEFAIFGDLAGLLLPNRFAATPIVAGSAIIVGGACFLVFFILFRYGLRGFVVSDMLHSPFVVLSTLVALVALAVAVRPTWEGVSSAMQPIIPTLDASLFVVHVFALNMVLILLTEGHWFRLWLFRSGEDRLQVPSMAVTGTVWAILGLAGCLAGLLTKEAGTPGVEPIVATIQSVNPGLALIFWIGAAAAVFSVADAQIYNILLVNSFDSRTGLVSKKIDRPGRPALSALVVSFLFAAVYAITRGFGIPFEKLVFFLFHLCLNILPGLTAIAIGKEPSSRLIIVSTILYIICSIVGLFLPEHEVRLSLAAALVPFFITLVILIPHWWAARLGKV